RPSALHPRPAHPNDPWPAEGGTPESRGASRDGLGADRRGHVRRAFGRVHRHRNAVSGTRSNSLQPGSDGRDSKNLERITWPDAVTSKRDVPTSPSTPKTRH